LAPADRDIPRPGILFGDRQDHADGETDDPAGLKTCAKPKPLPGTDLKRKRKLSQIDSSRILDATAKNDEPSAIHPATILPRDGKVAT